MIKYKNKTLSFNSFLLIMTAVICWSIKIKIVAIIAGSMASGISQSLFFSTGETTQDLWLFVG